MRPQGPLTDHQADSIGMHLVNPDLEEEKNEEIPDLDARLLEFPD